LLNDLIIEMIESFICSICSICAHLSDYAMSFDDVGISYLVLIPVVFALIVVGQGAYKLSRQERDGGVVLTFGIIFLALIGAAWVFFIR